MNPSREKISQQFETISQRLWLIRGQLDQLLRYLDEDVDRLAIEEILTSLAWASENTKVVSLHLIGEALEDTMGF